MKTTWKWKLAQSREIRWWQRYLKKKDKGNYLNWKKNYWHETLDPVRKEVQLNYGENVLDAGCGPAGAFMILDRYNVDAEDPLIDEYETHLEHFKKNDYPWVNFYSVALENFTPGKQYQCVFCMNAINHVADINASFDKLTNLTKNKGYLLISVDAHNYSLFKKLFRLIPMDVLHPHQFDLKEYKAMLTSRNCEIIVSKLVKKEFFFTHYLLTVRKN